LFSRKRRRLWCGTCWCRPPLTLRRRRLAPDGRNLMPASSDDGRALTSPSGSSNADAAGGSLPNRSARTGPPSVGASTRGGVPTSADTRWMMYAISAGRRETRCTTAFTYARTPARRCSRWFHVGSTRRAGAQRQRPNSGPRGSFPTRRRPGRGQRRSSVPWWSGMTVAAGGSTAGTLPAQVWRAPVL
jgi:hypothetical protein